MYHLPSLRVFKRQLVSARSTSEVNREMFQPFKQFSGREENPCLFLDTGIYNIYPSMKSIRDFTTAMDFTWEDAQILL